MNPYTGTANLTVIKRPLTSNGNTDWDSTAFDTATQLTATTVVKFKSSGFEIVGHYLTGTGSNKRPKNLTANEIALITTGGLSIFPIYEDGQFTIKTTTNTDGSYPFEVAWTAFETKEGILNQTLTIALEIKINLPDFPSQGTFAGALKQIGQIAAGATILTIIVVETLPADIESTVVAAVATMFKTIVTGQYKHRKSKFKFKLVTTLDCCGQNYSTVFCMKEKLKK